MSNFWKQNITSDAEALQQAEQALPVQLDEEALAEIQEPEYNVFEDEEDDMSEVLSDANLRLEQGRLYQMIMNHDIFGQTDADPKAIRNVQREIRKFARDRMEIMLGMRQEQKTQEVVVSSPFNDMEVTVLKMLASKMSKGATESSEPAPPPEPKKDGITAISGNLRPQAPAPLRKAPKQPIHRAAKTTQSSPAPQPVKKTQEDSALKKPIDQMTAQELAEHDKQASERQKKMYAANPGNMTPHPSPQQLEAMYAVQVSRAMPALTANGMGVITQGSAINSVMSMIGNR